MKDKIEELIQENEHNKARAEAAEARAAGLENKVEHQIALVDSWIRAYRELSDRRGELLESNRELHEANDILRAEVVARRLADVDIRTLIGAYPEHDTVEAVKRHVDLLALVRQQLEQAQAERDELARILERTQDRLGDLTEYDMDKALS